MSQRKSIWMVSREYDGLAGAGGVKDVCRQLAEVLATTQSNSVSAILPRYGFMDAIALGFTPVALPGMKSGMIGSQSFDACFQVDMNYTERERRETVALWHSRINEVDVFLVEAASYADKQSVYTYTEEEEGKESWKKSGSGHFDYFAMNILLQKAALNFMLAKNIAPWVIHCHDGHAALLPVMMRELDGYRQFFAATGAVVTIHNAGLGYHQEVEDLAFAQAVTGLPLSLILGNRLGLGFDPFVAASKYAIVNTVSENYGRELQETPEDIRTGWLGHTLKDNGVELLGVTNGIDPAAFDTREPSRLNIIAGFNVLAGELEGKQACKLEMIQQASSIRQWEYVEQFGTLSINPEAPLFTFIGRLTEQKGIDVVLNNLAAIFALRPESQILILGSGDKALEERIRETTRQDKYRGHICLLRGYDPMVANQVYAAGDFFLIPSRYEPCGLTDYIAQLFGNIPIVHHVGGLVKVADGVTGFAYSPDKGVSIMNALERALDLYDQPAQKYAMQLAAVEKIYSQHSWQKVMADYISLYEQSKLSY